MGEKKTKLNQDLIKDIEETLKKGIKFRIGGKIYHYFSWAPTKRLAEDIVTEVKKLGYEAKSKNIDVGHCVVVRRK